MNDSSSRYSIAEILVILISTVAIGFFYAGFYYPDSYFLERASTIYTLLLWAVRILMPVGLIGMLGLYHGVKTGKLSAANIGLLAGSLILAGLLLYPVASYLYNRSVDHERNIGQFHPYLQLTPKEYAPRDGADPTALRIFCLGGSTTEWKDDDGRGWPARVEENLIRESGRENLEVHNLGRQWYTSQHSLINYVINLRHHRPRMIIVMHVINDLVHNADFSYFAHEPFREDYRHFYGPVNEIVTRQGFESYLFGKFSRYWYNEERRIVEQSEFPGLEAYSRKLNALIDIAAMDGVKVVLMTQPHLLKPEMSEEELAALYMVNNEAIGPEARWSHMTALRAFDAYNQRIRDIAAERGAVLVDLETAIPRTLEYFTDDVHYRDNTYDLIGDFVAGALLRSGVIDELLAAGTPGSTMHGSP